MVKDIHLLKKKKLIEIHQFAISALLILSILLLSYSTVLFNVFGVLDDYQFLYSSLSDEKSSFTILISAGRPINALFFYVAFKLAGSLTNLVYLRAISLIGIWSLGLMLYYFLRVHRFSFAFSLTVASSILLLPSFQVYAAWAQHFTTAFAGSLALLSALIISPSFIERSSKKEIRMASSIIFLIISLLIYQPIAMLFCTGVCIFLLSRFKSNNDINCSELLNFIIVYVTSMIFAFCIFEIGKYYFPIQHTRFGVNLDFLAKIHWFLFESMRNAFSFYIVPPSEYVAISACALLCILTSSFLFVKRISARIKIKVFVLLSMGIIASYAPNLITGENWAAYRSLVALNSTLLFIFIFFVSNYIPSFFVKSSGKYLLVILGLVLILTAQRNVLSGFVMPNVTELNNLSSLIKAKGPINEKIKIIVKPSSWNDSSAKPIAYDEFGMHSSITPYYARAIVGIVLRDLYHLKNFNIVIIDKEDNSSISADSSESFTINFQTLVTSQNFIK